MLARVGIGHWGMLGLLVQEGAGHVFCGLALETKRESML